MGRTEWVEGGQRFHYDGLCIRSRKPAKIRMLYGDERLRLLREERERAQPAPRKSLRDVLSRLFGRKRAGSDALPAIDAMGAPFEPGWAVCPEGGVDH